MKICIVTLSGNYNYGNKLQNYALERTLLKFGYQVETLWIDNNDIENSVITKIKILIKRMVDNEFSKKIRIEHQKTKAFINFSNKYLNELHRPIKKYDQFQKLVENYDYFIVGSDQVWNPYFLGDKLPIYLLQFVPNDKRISYAASFGISELPRDLKNGYKEQFQNFKAISVREKNGASIIKELINSEVEVVLDPTMLLDCEEWRKLSSSADRVVKYNYLLTYYLGDLPLEYQQYINKVAKEKNLEIINIGSISNEDIYKLDPSGFLNLIDNCDIFFTDSFHGCVFSILFEKPFVVFQRQGGIGMYSRIETLLEDFLLKERAYENINNDNLYNIDYKRTNEILQDKRKNSMNFLVNNIK